MRMWHKDLIPYLPRQQLLGQWRECCAIARSIEKKGTPNHVLVNKIMDYDAEHFNTYVFRVYEEMARRGYRADWERYADREWSVNVLLANDQDLYAGWHNDRYLAQCLANLQEKYDCGAVPEEDWKNITARWPEWR